MPVNNVSLTSPYSAEQAAIERRRRMAEALQAQSMQPIESQTAGGWVVPISPWQGAAKLAQGLFGGLGASRADAQQKALAERLMGERQKTVQEARTAFQGTPERMGGEAGTAD